MQLISWRARWRIYEYVRNSIWIVPAVFAICAIALGMGLPAVDRHTTVRIGIDFGPDAARGMLGAIAGGMITFTGFVFSILLLAVQFGSSQFSPRMLRRFLRDPTTKVALGVFMATFIYALLVLRVVGTGNNKGFVPNNSISVAIFLLLLSMLMFLRLINRTTQGLRVAAVLRELGRDARRFIDAAYPERFGQGAAEEQELLPPGSAFQTITYRGEPAVLQSVDSASIIARAQKQGVMIELVPRFGDFVVPGAPLFRVFGATRMDESWLHRSIATGDERTLRQDPAFALRLLADISAKALSPGVNDPTTSTQALDQIDLLLRMLGNRNLASNVRRDPLGAIRFWYPVPSWEDYVSLAVDETRLYGEGSIQVTRRLRTLLEDLRESLPEVRRPAIDAEIKLVDAGAGRAFVEPGDRVAATARDHQGLGATESVNGHERLSL